MFQHIEADHNVKLASRQRIGRLDDVYVLLIRGEDLLRELNALVRDFVICNLMSGRREIDTVEAETISKTQYLQASARCSFGEEPPDPVAHLQL